MEQITLKVAIELVMFALTMIIIIYHSKQFQDKLLKLKEKNLSQLLEQRSTQKENNKQNIKLRYHYIGLYHYILINASKVAITEELQDLMRQRDIALNKEQYDDVEEVDNYILKYIDHAKNKSCHSEDFRE